MAGQMENEMAEKLSQGKLNLQNYTGPSMQTAYLLALRKQYSDKYFLISP